MRLQDFACLGSDLFPWMSELHLGGVDSEPQEFYFPIGGGLLQTPDSPAGTPLL